MSIQKQKSVHSIIINSIRLVLVLIFIVSLNTNSPIMQFVSFFAFLVTYLPFIFQRYFKIEIPARFEILILLFIYGLLFIGEVRSFYSFWLWDILLNFIASITLGFIGLSVIYVLYKDKRLNINITFIAILSFCFAFSIGVLWEIFEFFLDRLFNSGLQESLADTMEDLIVNAIGAFVVSFVGSIYIKKGKSLLISTLLTKFIEENKWIFGPKNLKAKEKPSKKVMELIKRGENEKIEFKSSFRVNLHTKEFDRRIEHGVLKSIVAFLNTRGGYLLVGVNDGGHVLGLDEDGFKNDDKLRLHLTNLIKEHIGNEFLPFIKFGIVEIKEKKVLLIICKESKKRVFLKMDQEEEFYVRNGPASVRLGGSSLVDYIQHKFEDKE